MEKDMKTRMFLCFHTLKHKNMKALSMETPIFSPFNAIILE